MNSYKVSQETFFLLNNAYILNQKDEQLQRIADRQIFRQENEDFIGGYFNLLTYEDV